MQDDRLSAAGNLDRTVGVAGIGDVGGIGARAKRGFTRHELQRLAALEAVADPIGFRSNLPGIGEESLAGGIGGGLLYGAFRPKRPIAAPSSSSIVAG